MVYAIAYDEVKINQRRIADDPGRGTKGGIIATNFFDFPKDDRAPHATLYQFDPGRVSLPHFHIVDQFQVVVGGKGEMGRHDLSTYGVHFSRAYTPYGPFKSDAATGLTCFVMHAHSKPDWRSHHLPQEKDSLLQVAHRQPWQTTFAVPYPISNETGAAVMLAEVPGSNDEYGLAAYSLSMKPNTIVNAPDPSRGDGQYLIVIGGSLLFRNKEYKALALVFVEPSEGLFPINAGAEGLDAIILNFPRPLIRQVSSLATGKQ